MSVSVTVTVTVRPSVRPSVAVCACLSVYTNLMFSAPPGASRTVVINHDKWNTGVQGTLFTHVNFNDFVDVTSIIDPSRPGNT